MIVPMADKGAPVRIASDDPDTASLWGDLGRLAAHVLPPDWTLVGGLMVERGIRCLGPRGWVAVFAGC